MRSVVKNLGMGGGLPVGVGDFLQCCGSGITSLRIRDIGDDPPHDPGPRGFPAQDGQAGYRETAPEASGRKLGVYPLVGGNVGGGVRGGGGVCLE